MSKYLRGGPPEGIQHSMEFSRVTPSQVDEFRTLTSIKGNKFETW